MKRVAVLHVLLQVVAIALALTSLYASCRVNARNERLAKALAAAERGCP